MGVTDWRLALDRVPPSTNRDPDNGSHWSDHPLRGMNMSDRPFQLPPEIEAELPSNAPESESFFLTMADKVSEGMGKPANIIVWFIAVVVWTLLFAVSKKLAKGTFLPAWFTSQGYNFPLNLVTTVAELFIGFLVAAATNRAERANDRLLARVEAMESVLLVELQANTALTTQVMALTTEVKTHTDLLEEIHRHVAALSAKAVNQPTEPPSH
jgi:low affinity Fe/Cu permease